MTLSKGQEDKICDLLNKATYRAVPFGALSRQGKLIVSQLLLEVGDRSRLPDDLGAFRDLVSQKSTRSTADFLRKRLGELERLFGRESYVVYMLSTAKLVNCLKDVSPHADGVLPRQGDFDDLAYNIVRREKPGSIVLAIRNGNVSVHGAAQLRQAIAIGIRTVCCVVVDFDRKVDSGKSTLRHAFSSLQDLKEVVGLESEILNPVFNESEDDVLNFIAGDGEQASLFRAMYKSRRCTPLTTASIAVDRHKSSVWCQLNFICPRCYAANYVIPLERFRRQTDAVAFWKDRHCVSEDRGVEFILLKETVASLFSSELWERFVRPVKAAVLPIYNRDGTAAVRSILLVNQNEHRIFRNFMLNDWTKESGPTDYSVYSNRLITGVWRHEPVCWARHKAFANNGPYPRLMRSKNVRRSN